MDGFLSNLHHVQYCISHFFKIYHMKAFFIGAMLIIYSTSSLVDMTVSNFCQKQCLLGLYLNDWFGEGWWKFQHILTFGRQTDWSTRQLF